MKVPHADAALVQEEKIVGYLLNPSHPRGAAKAKFFSSIGFHADQWEELATALREVATDSSVTLSLESEHGWKYIVDGEIESPSSRRVTVRTVWIVDRGGEIPRLVTAYPHDESRRQ